MSDDKPAKAPSWLERLSQALTGEPKNREALVQLLRNAEDRHLLNADSLGMIEGVMQVSEMQVRDIMVPRSQMVVISAEKPLKKIVPLIIESGHSRFPVIGETRDEIVGVLLAKDLLKYYFSDTGESEFDLNKLLRPATFVPESKRLDVLLREFKDKHNHLAIVADEYGGIGGLVTIEDVLEQIVGDIEDEYDIDEDDQYIKPISKTEFNINALTTVEDFNEYFHTDFSDEQFDTIGGLVLNELGHLPKRGETAQVNGYEFTVLHADNRRIQLLRLIPPKM